MKTKRETDKEMEKHTDISLIMCVIHDTHSETVKYKKELTCGGGINKTLFSLSTSADSSKEEDGWVEGVCVVEIPHPPDPPLISLLLFLSSSLASLCCCCCCWCSNSSMTYWRSSSSSIREVARDLLISASALGDKGWGGGTANTSWLQKHIKLHYCSSHTIHLHLWRNSLIISNI